MSKTHIGKNIKAVRRLRGLTQEELAAKINKTRALVSHTEQTGKVSHYTLTAIAKMLNVSVEYLENFNEKLVISNEPIVAYGKTEMETLKEQLENCQKKNNILRYWIDSQKKIIQMLEKKKK